MTVLVSVESRHGATEQIGQRVARILIDAGWPVDVLRPAEVTHITPYAAVVIGSAVYGGAWLAPARELVERFAIELRERPVWLFSSGPIGDPPKPIGDPAGVAPLVRLIQPRGHGIFAGRLVDEELGIAEKLMTRAVRAPHGDFRNWRVVDAWAGEIVRALEEIRPPAVAAGVS
jgi:menaquinone-dependent protoporphyrinogen oxidase